MNLFCKTAITGCLLLLTLSMRAQVIMHIGSGGQVYISAKTAVSFDSLVMLPSSKGFLLGENNISKLSAPNNPFTGAYLKRAYCFSKPVADYSGSLGIFYNESEAAGINVNNLLVQAYTGYAWHPQRDEKGRNARRNVVSVPGLHHLSFSELLLGYGPPDPLPDPDSSGYKMAPAAIAPTADASLRVTVYPNPVIDIVNLSAGNGTMIKRVKVFDASGKLVMMKEGSNSNTYSFNVSALTAGFYLLAIETSTGKVSKGFMKQ